MGGLIRICDGGQAPQNTASVPGYRAVQLPCRIAVQYCCRTHLERAVHRGLVDVEAVEALAHRRHQRRPGGGGVGGPAAVLLLVCGAEVNPVWREGAEKVIDISPN